MFPHLSDLLLATQLAALREGYTAIGTYWDSKSSSKIWVTCQVELISQRTERCIHRLVRAALVDSSKPHESWIVEIVRNENLGVEQHPRHHGGIGRSKGFKVSRLAFFLVVTFWFDNRCLVKTVEIAETFQGQSLQELGVIPSVGSRSACFLSRGRSLHHRVRSRDAKEGI